MPTLLLVDDEPGILETLSTILTRHGLETTAVGTVGEALNKIMSRKFDVLISDLNIGEPGDGFTVVSAMRRVQPKCRTFILTGYPAFESALLAIRSQVDDYLVKPASIPALIAAIQKSLEEDLESSPSQPRQRLSVVLREHLEDVVDETLRQMKADRQLSALPLKDHERTDHVPQLIRELSGMLDSARPDETTSGAMETAAAHGLTRFKQGYSVDMLVVEMRLLIRAINDVVQNNILELDMSNLISDLKWLDESVCLQLGETVRAYVRAENEMAA